MPAALNPTGSVSSPSAQPAVRRIGPDDLHWALQSGWQDFVAKRGDVLFVALLYPAIGLITAVIALKSSLLPFFFPLAAGLSILGPIVASGFYELARRREQNEPAGWSHFLDPLLSDRRNGIVGLAAMMVGLFAIWLAVAWALYAATLGQLEPVGAAGFVSLLFTTADGWMLIIFGNAAGALIAAATLVLTLVSAPMLVDRPVSVDLAVRTSLRAAAMNPGATARWGATVAALLLLGSIPVFIGLAIVLPVLGYATWHLYTRIVER
ncbi:DUF2189 domain-containing protein [Sphingomonas sp. BIUV-7]|uniref:DUF2189 domain-containing protein n=1 Tax=Sphingomonas natans TaxID=3063330 RepID=A0ABT8YD19_9SPHN|nr:DUF2189 domain-containing protein [Sphingomonas sp. BIUV-7]MDO6416244.1 DUF2189 domain-containing protein [Sphingomonas sp. BIUV-7]